MIVVLLNWAYVAITTFLLGVGFAAIIKKVTGYRVKKMDSLLMMGLVIASVYAQFFSLVCGVALAANAVLVLICMVVAVCCRETILSSVRELKRGRNHPLLGFSILLLLIIAWSYFTSRGYMHYDSDLYHAQSIEWIERYGVVKGLGNFHVRFAYNSSFFALSALYSFSFLKGVSLHALSGFFALLLSITCMELGKVTEKKRLDLSDFARVAAIYYLFTIVDEVVAPASDYSTMLVIFFLVIKYLDHLELLQNRQPQAKEPTSNCSLSAPFALLCVLGVYAMTLKLTAALILIVLFFPMLILLREKRGKEILFYLGSGLCTAVPWLIRTVVISGWLFYPLPSLDLFSFDWKINAERVLSDANDIKAWGRALYNGSLVDVPVTGWFPNWFQTTLSGTEKLLVLGSLTSLVGLLLLGISLAAKKKWDRLPTYGVLAAVGSSYLVWQLSAPLMRYGYVYVLLTLALTMGWLFQFITEKISNPIKGRIHLTLFCLLALYGAYKLTGAAAWVGQTYLYPYYVQQQPYGTYEMGTYEVGGETFYYPIGGDRSGYAPFPAGPENPYFTLRGQGLEDGFR